jgi:hypothetical protein
MIKALPEKNFSNNRHVSQQTIKLFTLKAYWLTATIFLVILLPNQKVYSQGCVAIRSFGGCTTGAGGSAILMPGESMIGANYRYFESFRHFRGSHEEDERIENGTQVINNSNFLDLTFTYSFAERFYASLTVPFVYHDRSSMYEHGGNNLGDRHSTSSQGLADMRLGAGYWLLDQKKHAKGNLALALGMKFPTGNYKATDTFYNVGENGEAETRPVDQSIQPGDGGFGITVEFQGYQQLGASWILNGNLFYLINPRETNGVARSNSSSSIMSVPDQFAGRLGMTYMTPLHGLDAYLGGRVEGIPVYDLIGGSEGFRRPGYVISLEPGVNYGFRNLFFNVSVPIALVRNRTQSFTDKQREEQTGNTVHGDAAFADYLINVGVTWKFSAKHKTPEIKLDHTTDMYSN